MLRNLSIPVTAQLYSSYCNWVIVAAGAAVVVAVMLVVVATVVVVAVSVAVVQLQKSIPDIFDCNLKTNYQILIIFRTNIPDATCHQMTIQFPTSPYVCSCTTRGEHNQRNIIFYPMRCDCLINITRKNTLYSYFWHYGWHFIQLSIFQLPTVKLLEVLAHYVNTGKETLSPFIDSSVNNVLLQTNPGSISHFLTLQTFLNFIW